MIIHSPLSLLTATRNIKSSRNQSQFLPSRKSSVLPSEKSGCLSSKDVCSFSRPLEKSTSMPSYSGMLPVISPKFNRKRFLKQKPKFFAERKFNLSRVAKNIPKEEKDTSSNIKVIKVGDEIQLYKTHLERFDERKSKKQLNKRIKITGGKVNLEDLAYGASVSMKSKLVNKNGELYYEYFPSIDEKEEKQNSNCQYNDKILELVEKYKEKKFQKLKIYYGMPKNNYDDRLKGNLYENLVKILMKQNKYVK